MRSLLSFILVVTAFGCSSVSTTAPAPSASVATSSEPPHATPPDDALAALHADTGIAVGPLSDYCKDAACVPYDRARADLERRVANGCSASPVAEIGTCGDLRFLEEIPGGLMGSLRYYDARGSLVAVMQYNIEHPGARWAGPPQSCTLAREIDLCAAAQR